MTVTETLGALGSWEVQLTEATPDYIVNQLGFFGHIAIVDGPVDVDATGAGLLTGARYVGVLRAKDRTTGRKLAGSGMVFWLGDEDGKGDILETEVSLTAQTLSQSVTAIVGPSTAVTVGTVFAAAGTYTGKHQFQTRREALGIICDAFNVEFRVNGNGTVDVGTAAQLYNTAAPDTIIVRKGAGTDMDLVALGGDYEVDESVYDYSSRVVLLGQTVGTGDTADEVFATGSANALSVPYLNLRGNTVAMVRTISESGTTSGSVTARAQLQLNRFNRVARSLKVTAEEYETEGNFVVGDNVYVYDPDTGIVNPAVEVPFRGELLHPDVVRASGITWPVVQGMTVAFRTQAGVWLDLTPFVTWESGGNELTVGDLPKSLTSPGDNPVQVRVDAVRADASIPNAPTGLTLTTFSSLNAKGQTVAIIRAVWTAPSLNTDGSVISDLSHYLVQYRPQFRAPQWQQSIARATTDIDLEVTPSLVYDVEVAAVDLGGKAGAFTAVSSITSAADALAPNPPADPIVTNYLGQLRIEYSGTDSLGNPMASDTNRIDVHVGTTNSFVASTATRVDSINPFAKGVSYATAPYGVTRYVRLIAVDHTGNSSASTSVIAGTTAQVVSADVFDGAIGSAKLADLAVITAKIADLAVNDAKIGSLSVGKLTAGTMSADVVVSGRFTSALTGARREMNSVGFQAFDATSTLLINLDGTNNLLTGLFKTALSGRRIEIGSAGNIGRIRFIAPDGTLSEVIGFSSGLGAAGQEAIRIGIPVTGTYGAWNGIQVEDDEQIFLSGQYVNVTVGGRNNAADGFFVRYAADKGTTSTAWASSTRLQIDNRNFVTRDTLGRAMYHVTSESAIYLHRWYTYSNDNPANPVYDGYLQLDSSTRTEVSSRLTFSTRVQTNGFGYGGSLRYWVNVNPYTNPRLEVWDVGMGTLIDLWANAFTVGSDETRKDNVRDLDVDALSVVKRMKPRKWDEKDSAGGVDNKGDPVGKTKGRAGRIGLVAQEAPAEVVFDGGGEVGLGIDVYALATFALAGVQQLEARVSALEAGGKKP